MRAHTHIQIIVSYEYISVSLFDIFICTVLVCMQLCVCHLIHLHNCQNLLIHLFENEQYISMGNRLFFVQRGCVWEHVCMCECVHKMYSWKMWTNFKESHTFYVLILAFGIQCLGIIKYMTICICNHSYRFHLFGCIPNTTNISMECIFEVSFGNLVQAKAVVYRKLAI